MIQKRKVSKLVLLGCVLSLGFAAFFSPVTTLSVQAATGGTTVAEPKKDNIAYRFAIFDGKLYKRLYNFSTGNWIGDWIYVCDAN